VVSAAHRPAVRRSPCCPVEHSGDPVSAVTVLPQMGAGRTAKRLQRHRST
jgi:hypothetical protein